MAYMAMNSTFVTGAVAGETIVEGVAVVLTASGVHDDLPVARIASAGTRDVYVALVPPDMFPRPTPAGMFQYRQISTSLNNPVGMGNLVNSGFNPQNAQEYVVDSGQRGPEYLIGPSLLQEPIAQSGWKLQAHQGGAYTLTAGAFVDSADIRVIGNKVAVGANGKFVYSTNAAQIVGRVREYRNGRLTIVLDQRSA